MKPTAPLVLIVDDDEDSREMYAVGLSVMGLESCQAGNVEDGLRLARERRPDIVVTGITLPGRQSGLDLTRQLRQDDATRQTGIIVLTGHAFAAVKDEALVAGCDCFMVKPCLPDALARAIRALLADRRRVDGDPR